MLLNGTIGGIISLCAIVITFILLRWRKKNVGNRVAFVGLSDSGKTVLFHQLRLGKPWPTQMSMRESEDDILVTDPRGKPLSLHILDMPGHSRLFYRVKEVLPTVRGVLFVVDAASFGENKQAVAEYLYDVLANPHVSKNRVPVVLVLNKTDEVARRKEGANENAALTEKEGEELVEHMSTQLANEIDLLRRTRAGSHGSMSDLSGSRAAGAAAAASDFVFLGDQKHSFAFSQLANPIRFCCASAQRGEADQVQKALSWIATR
ncbi:putative Signal recognition particle receptor subunit beta [Paratrimastix pyriformis]|uniref:Signal recognition particle receptor subunit beta n=1 Tax=Paratrimastix pyriformis TaxID=342808 RepID=A0ABQ8USW6_9EUKA|nr:putative Signal recognition particle receptor subunit beta [Paratrimastix pyriformis]